MTRAGDTIVGRIDYVEIADDSFTEVIDHSFGWVDVPGMTKTFSQNGGQPNEVVVDFSSVFYQNGGEGSIRVYVDNVLLNGIGSGTIILPAGDSVGTISQRFVTEPLGRGDHTVKIQMSSAQGSVALGSRSMIIHHR